jgi:hypothetical protein
MLLASVHLSPNWSTAFWLTARNEWCATCWTNHGCGEVSFTSSVCASRAFTPTLSRRASQFDLHELYSSAPTMPKNWYE